MRITRIIAILVFCMTPLAAAAELEARHAAHHHPSSVVEQPNILIVIADDVGVDVVSLYREGFEFACSASGAACSSGLDCPAEQTCQPNFAPTPTIDALAANGILFRNAW